ncbi:ATP-binding cassette domain-containing protein, partial [bacterium]|nr:ATP-binding cassette domain-containing protein [bacterium]
MNYLLETQGVVKRYGAYTALDHVSIRIPEGCIFGLLGPNGAGKTTLIRIINQITAPDEGSVLLSGEKLAQHHI